MPIRQLLHDSGVLEVVLDIPPVNAVDLDHLDELTAMMKAMPKRHEVRVVVLRSEGKGFVGGGDVKEVQRLPGHAGIFGQANGSCELSVALHECDVPVIAAVHRYCIGLGVLIVGSCDIVVATKNSVFVLAEVDKATGGAIQASGLMPDKRLRAAMLTCEPVPAEELLQYGSIYRLVAEDDLRQVAIAVGEVIAAKPSHVVRAAKRAINGSIGRRIRELYWQQLSYTYDLNLLGEAAEAHTTFVDGSRKGYLSPN